MIAVIIGSILMLKTLGAHAHSYPIEVPTRVDYGTCFAVGGSGSYNISRCNQLSVAPGPCDNYSPSAAPFKVPSATTTWLNSGVTGSHGWVPLNKNNAPSPNTCTARTVRCAQDKTWVGSTTGGKCNTLAATCDSEHVQATRGDLSTWCDDKPEHQCLEGNGYWNHTTNQCEVPQQECEAGETWDSSAAMCRPSCSLNQTYNYQEQVCDPNCVPGEKNYYVTFGDDKKSYCGIPMPEDNPKTCQKIIGYINNKQICGDAKAECDASGGTFGSVNGKEVCLPEDYGDDLPTCAGDGEIVIAEGAGFVCEAPEKLDKPPESEKPDKSDIDGDGIPDKDDPDMDGDGTPNSEDEDKDGDGIPNEDDGNADGPGDDESSVSGGSCDEKPSCKGDAIQCATLHQIWSLRCESDKVTLDGDGCNTQPGCDGDAVDCAIVLSDWRTECARKEGEANQQTLNTYINDNAVIRIDKPDVDVGAIGASVFEVTGPLGTCPADETVVIRDTTYTFSYQAACDAATKVRPFVLAATGIMAAIIIHGAF